MASHAEENAMARQLEIRILKAIQPIGELLVGVISCNDLLEISYADVRRLESSLDNYLGIQRRLSSARVKDLKAYVLNIDATFPTSIVLAISGSCAQLNTAGDKLLLRETDEIPFSDIAQILDGQHRIEGLRDYKGPSPFDLIVTIILDADIADQAYIFSTVNLAQTKVNKSLAYDLFDYSKSRSPQKTAHDVAVALDKHPHSPFFERIKRLGVATSGRSRSAELLTQSTFVEAVIDFISSNPKYDRNILLSHKKLPKLNEAVLKKLPFRGLFIDEKDLEITEILLNYFSAVRDKWPTAWDSKEPGIILPRTNGFLALMRFLKPAYLALCGDAVGKVFSQGEWKPIFDRIQLSDNDFTRERFLPGTTGESELVKTLRTQSGI